MTMTTYFRILTRYYKSGIANEPTSRGGGVNLGGSSGSTDNPTSKKIPFLYHSDHSEYD